jgi:PAS domain S-box-containing protein
LIEILNDDETGDEVLQKVRNAANGGAKHILDDEETDNFSTDPVATFVVSCDTERFGQIVALNQAGASMFWYNKSELINQKIQILMPKMYAKHHDTFLENFLNNGDVKNHVKERIVFTKNKAGYISPVSLQIR